MAVRGTGRMILGAEQEHKTAKAVPRARAISVDDTYSLGGEGVRVWQKAGELALGHSGAPYQGQN